MGLEEKFHIKGKILFHLDSIKREFNDGALCEEHIENADGMYCIVNLDFGKTLGLIGDQHVNNTDLVSRDQQMNMMVCISGGTKLYGTTTNAFVSKREKVLSDLRSGR